MPIKSNKTIEEQIKHGEHLTFVDKMRAAFMPAASTDDMTGRPSYPKEEFLSQKAKERKEEADLEAKRKK